MHATVTVAVALLVSVGRDSSTVPTVSGGGLQLPATRVVAFCEGLGVAAGGGAGGVVGRGLALGDEMGAGVPEGREVPAGPGVDRAG